MCGRYVSPERAAIERAWQVGRGNSNPFGRRYNVLPTTEIPILVEGSSGGLELAQARWGLIPSWWKQDKPPAYSINARAEEAAAKPMWRQAWRRSRCLIPAEGWYEWQAAQRTVAASGEARAYKQPHYIYRRDRRPVCFAGLMETSPAAQLTCAILTRAASASLAEIHDRMPVVLPDELLLRWVRADVDKAEDVDGMVKLAQSNFAHHAVSTKLNSAKTDDPALVAPLEQASQGRS
ncbi:MAG TPA: SOS response-associated peptidase [Burkholderiales bacterium]|nr:SOS response-associated peptidase [Burkholderiales bacterium]